jgi:hypothetical protein
LSENFVLGLRIGLRVLCLFHFFVAHTSSMGN